MLDLDRKLTAVREMILNLPRPDILWSGETQVATTCGWLLWSGSYVWRWNRTESVARSWVPGNQTHGFFGCERLRADELGQEMAKWFEPLSPYQNWRKELKAGKHWEPLQAFPRFERCTQLERELHSNKVGHRNNHWYQLYQLYQLSIILILWIGFVCTDADICSSKLLIWSVTELAYPDLCIPNRALAVRERGKTRWKTKLEN